MLLVIESSKISSIIISLLIGTALSTRRDLSGSQNYCFQPDPINSLPQIVGGALGETQFLCMDYDSVNSRLIVGGWSSSSDIVQATSTPILINFDLSDGSVLWHSQVQQTDANVVNILLPLEIIKCTIQDGVIPIYVVAASKNPKSGIQIFDYTNGSLLKSFYEYDSSTLTADLSKQILSLTMRSNGRILQLIQNGDSNELSSFAFDVNQAQITPLYFKKFGQAANQMYAQDFSLVDAYSSGYIAGQYSSNFVLMKIAIATGAISFSYSFTNPTGTSSFRGLYMVKVYPSSASNAELVGCSQYLGSSQKDTSILSYTEASSVLTLDKAWYFSRTTSTTCIDVNLDNNTIAFAFGIDDTYIAFGSFNRNSASTANNSAINIRLSSSSQTYTRSSFIVDKDNIFFAGYTNRVNTQTYSQNSGFVSSYPTSSCITTTQASITVTRSIINTFTNPAGNLFNSLSVSVVTANVLNKVFKAEANLMNQDLQLYNSVNLPSTCVSSISLGTISNPLTFPSPIQFQIGGGSQEYSISDFQYSLASCDDLQWTYTATKADGSALLTYLSFSQISTGGMKLSFVDDLLMASLVVSIKIQAQLNGQVTSSYTFSVTLLASIITTSTELPTSTSTLSTSFESSTSTSIPETSSTYISSSTSIPESSSTELSTSTQQPTSTLSSSHESSSSTSIPESSSYTSTADPTSTSAPTAASTSASSYLSTEIPSSLSTQIPSLLSTQNPTILSTQAPTPTSTPAFNTAPYFKEQIQSEIIIQAKSRSVLLLPQIIDQENDPVTLQATQRGALSLPNFIKYDRSQFTFEPVNSDSGIYYHDIELSDTYLKNIYFLKVTVLKSKQEKPIIPKNETQNNQTNNTSNNQTSKPIDSNLSLSIASISTSQEVSLKFSKAINIEGLMNKLKEALQIMIKDRSEYSTIPFEIKQINEFSIVLLLRIDEPILISSGQERDNLIVLILKPQFITSKDTNMMINLKKIQMKEIPPLRLSNQNGKLDYFQILDTSSLLDQSTGLTQNILQSSLYGSLILSGVLGMSVQILWGMMNALQLIAHTPLLSLNFPAQVQEFLQSLFTILNFDVFMVNVELKKMFSLKSEAQYAAYNDRFNSLGYDNSNFIYLIGFPMFILFAHISLVLIYPLIRPGKIKQQAFLFYLYSIQQLKQKLRSYLFFSSFFRFFIEICLECFISILVCVYLNSFELQGDQASFAIGIVFALLSITFAIMLPVLFAIQTTQKMKEVLGEAGLFFNTKSKAYIFYYSIFIFRRLVFVMTVFFLSNVLYLQIVIFIHGNILYLIYLIYGKPITEGLYVEVFNEVITLLLSIFLVVFTDFVDDPYLKYEAGFAFIALFILDVAVNFALIIKVSVSSIIYSVRKLRYKWRLRKLISKQICHQMNLMKTVELRPLAYKSEIHEIKLHFITEEDLENETENCENYNPQIREDQTGLGFETRRDFFHIQASQNTSTGQISNTPERKQENSILTNFNSLANSRLYDQNDFTDCNIKHQPVKKLSLLSLDSRDLLRHKSQSMNQMPALFKKNRNQPRNTNQELKKYENSLKIEEELKEEESEDSPYQRPSMMIENEGEMSRKSSMINLGQSMISLDKTQSLNPLLQSSSDSPPHSGMINDYVPSYTRYRDENL